MPVDRKFHPRVGDSEKVARLTDMEFRVWFTYIMVADDFGVLPLAAAKIKAGDRTLANRTPKQITRALETLVSVGLARAFEHQGARYLWSANWQEHQEIRYPRREQTHYPAPPETELRALTGDTERSTRELFATFHIQVSEKFRHEFGNADTLRAIAERDAKRATTKPRRSRDIPSIPSSHSGNVAGTLREQSGNVADPLREHSGSVAALTRARAPETANGLRLPAEVLQEEKKETPPFAMDAAARDLLRRYHPQGRCGWQMVERPLFEVLTADPSIPPGEAYAALCARLEQQMASHQWRVKKMVPRLDKWLREGIHLQELPSEPPPADQLARRTSVTLHAAAAIMKGSA